MISSIITIFKLMNKGSVNLSGNRKIIKELTVSFEVVISSYRSTKSMF